MRTARTEVRIGVLAEDKTDCETLAVLIRRILGERTGIRKRHGGGCAMLIRKGAVWMAELADDGCTGLVFLHDLDRDPMSNQLNDPGTLYTRINSIPVPHRLPRHICIPIEELEAWFWSDPAVLERVAKGHGGSASTTPHAISKPKERLWHLSAKAHGNSRYTTQLNPDLARTLDHDRCAKHCPAFYELRQFLLSLR